jgi:hypothetical protein
MYRTLVLLAALWPSLVLACKPTPEWMALSSEERVKRLYNKATVVAHVRVLRSLQSDADVVVLESFKGPKSFGTIRADMTSCGGPLPAGSEFVLFSDDDRVASSLNTLSDNEASKALPLLRRLASSR